MISSVNAVNRFGSCFLTKEGVIEKHNVTGIMSLPSPDIARVQGEVMLQDVCEHRYYT
jgi:hypothetical protein